MHIECLLSAMIPVLWDLKMNENEYVGSSVPKQVYH